MERCVESRAVAHLSSRYAQKRAGWRVTREATARGLKAQVGGRPRALKSQWSWYGGARPQAWARANPSEWSELKVRHNGDSLVMDSSILTMRSRIAALTF